MNIFLSVYIKNVGTVRLRQGFVTYVIRKRGKLLGILILRNDTLAAILIKQNPLT